MNLKPKRLVSLVGICVLAGCTMVTKLPDDFSDRGASTGTLAQVAIQVRDSRGSEKIGVLSASPVKVKKNDIVLMAERSLAKMLNDDGISTIKISGIDFNDQTKLAAQARAHNGLVLFDLNSVRVSSIDVILDPPTYVAEGLLIFYDGKGQRVFATNVSGQKGSQAMFAKSIGDAVQSAILNASSSVRAMHEYDQWKNVVKS